MPIRLSRMAVLLQAAAPLASLGVVLVIACDSAAVRVRPMADDMRAWTTTVREFGPRQPTRLAVGDSATWAAFWSPPVGYGDRPVPPVDFRRETVLVFAEGQGVASSEPVPEYGGARRIGDTLVVTLRKARCRPGTDDIVYPMAVGRVPRHVGPVVFDFEVAPCRKGEGAVRRRFPAG